MFSQRYMLTCGMGQDANFGSALVEACKKVGVTVSAGSDILGGLGGATSTSSSEQTAASSRPTSTPGQNSYGSSATSTSSQTSQTSEPPTSESTGSDNRDGAASKSSGLSAGAAAGIGVAGAVIAMLLIIGAFLFWRRRGRAAKAVRDAGVMSAAGGSELAGTGIHEAYGSYTHTPEVEAKHPSAVSSPSPIKPSHTMVYELQGTMPETGNHTRDVAHQPQMPQ